MNVILFDGPVRNALLPLTYTRPVADLRIGILTIREKWEIQLGFTTTTVTESYLEEKFPMVEMECNIMINAAVLPSKELVDCVKNLKEKEVIFKGDDLIAFYSNENQEEINFEEYHSVDYNFKIDQINNVWNLLEFNEKEISKDFELLTKGKTSQPIPEGTSYINKENIFIEEGAELLFPILNASKGPIYIGKNTLIMEGSMIRGPFALGANSVVKMGAKIYGATCIGPGSTVGGEIKNSIIFGNSNKGHEGYLGDSIIGEWCNLGADTNNSNLKNNYSEVRLWSYETEGFARTGMQFLGLVMGDHSKSAINTMFNTGTVVGVSANLYGSNFPRNFVPSFSWGGSSGFKTYQLKEALDTCKLVYERKELDFDNLEEGIMKHIFEESSKYRNFK